MFDKKNYIILQEEKQDTNERILYILCELPSGYKLLGEVVSLQKNLRQSVLVYLQTPQGDLYPQEKIPVSILQRGKNTLDFVMDLPGGFRKFNEEDLAGLKSALLNMIEYAENSGNAPLILGDNESPWGVYEEVVNGINIHAEELENNLLAPIFKRNGLGYIRTTHFNELLKTLVVRYKRKEVLGILKLLGRLVTDKGRAYDKRVHFGQVDGKYYVVKMPQDTEQETEGNGDIQFPLMDEETSKNIQPKKENSASKIRLFGYYGGKSRISDKLNKLMTKSQIYIEPFIGSGAVLLNRDRSEIEIVNDFDPAISNLYAILADKEKGREFLDKVFRLPYDEGLFKMACEYQKNNFGNVSKVDQAVLTFALTTQSYNSARRQFSRGAYDTESYQRRIRSNLPRVYERLKGVQVYNKDALEIIKEVVDNPEVQLYLDCPYLHSLRGKGADKVYFKEMEYIDHVRMLETIQNAKCRILLSGYHADKDDLYDQYLLPHGWKSQELAKTIKSSQRQKQRDIASEWVWFNYDIPSERGMA